MAEIKSVDGFPGYYISSDGKAYSDKSGKLKELRQWVDSSGRYMMIRMKNADGAYKKLLVHRLVGKAFIANKGNKPEINHKDNNPKNNDVSNLEWCTRRENLCQSYKTMPPARNKNSCTLFKGDTLIRKFESVDAASRYAAQEFGCSASSMIKYLQWKDFYIIVDGGNRKNIADKGIHKTQNRNPIHAWYKGTYVGEFKVYPELAKFLKSQYGVSMRRDKMRASENQEIDGLRCVRKANFSMEISQ